MRFHRTAGHFELLGNFCVVAALKQQLGDLLLARAQANRPFLHASPFSADYSNQPTYRPHPATGANRTPAQAAILLKPIACAMPSWMRVLEKSQSGFPQEKLLSRGAGNSPNRVASPGRWLSRGSVGMRDKSGLPPTRTRSIPIVSNNAPARWV
jgi:hypothetical protein